MNPASQMIGKSGNPANRSGISPYARGLYVAKDIYRDVSPIPSIVQNDNIYESMTVCIAALADDGKEAILIADKLATSKGLLPHQIDMTVPKIRKINENVQVMFAGGLADAETIIERTINNIGESKFVEQVANLINQKHLEYLVETLTFGSLKTRGIGTPESFYKDYPHLLNSETGRNIDTILSSHILPSNTNFIVCGKDDKNIHKVYFLNNNPRFLPSLMTGGYSVIGSGWMYSNVSMIQQSYNPTLKMDVLEPMVLKAKKEAEKDRDVGDKEDIVKLN